MSVNNMVDALANLASTLALGAKENITVLIYGQWLVTSSEAKCVKEVKTTFLL